MSFIDRQRTSSSGYDQIVKLMQNTPQFTSFLSLEAPEGTQQEFVNSIYAWTLNKILCVCLASFAK
jgi:hypothetical protein